MKLTDFVEPQAVVAKLESTDRNGAIRELVEALCKAGSLPPDDCDSVAKAIIARENQGSTGFGKGVAVPHVKHPKVPRIMSAIGRSETGIDFSALDRAPVYTIFVLASPPENPDGHLAAMECIFKNLSRDNFRKFLRQSDTPAAILDLIREADEGGLG